MQLLISDANILIDMEEGQLLELMFKLPFAFRVPDLLFFDELEMQHAHWLDHGLQLGTLSGESVSLVSQLTRKHPRISRNDCMALVLAQQEKCPLLTGDKNLRQAAELEGIMVQGSIWLVGQLVIRRIISIESARRSYQRMEANGRRLPWKKAHQLLNELEKTLI